MAMRTQAHGAQHGAQRRHCATAAGQHAAWRPHWCAGSGSLFHCHAIMLLPFLHCRARGVGPAEWHGAGGRLGMHRPPCCRLRLQAAYPTRMRCGQHSWHRHRGISVYYVCIAPSNHLQWNALSALRPRDGVKMRFKGLRPNDGRPWLHTKLFNVIISAGR